MKILYTTEEGGKFKPEELPLSKDSLVKLLESKRLDFHAVLFPDDTIWDVKNGFREGVDTGRFEEVWGIISQGKGI